MGNWCIYIEGCGAHDNDRPYDSDAIAQECVEKLKAAGQTVRLASFMAGASPKNLLSEPRKGDACCVLANTPTTDESTES